MRTACGARISCTLGVLLALSTSTGAQSLRGQIAGTIRDESAAALPGVTITVTSPALLVPQIVRVSDERGEYQIPDLPTGTYRVAYDLPGFASLVREGIVITGGFAARVDVVMKVATVAETITVSGESPLIDVTNTRGGTTVSKDLLEAVPVNRNFQDTFLLVGGVYSSGPPLTGQTGQRIFAAGSGARTYGQQMPTQVRADGIIVQANEAPNFASVDEVDVKTFGNTAEVAEPAAAAILVVKSGGNEFHGRYTSMTQHKSLQSSNIDAALRAQGITAGDEVEFYHEGSADLGGRIIRNKLWFYGAFRDVRNKRTVPGYVDPGSDGLVPAITQNRLIKISYQATQSHKVIGLWSFNPNFEEENQATRFIPFETTTRHMENAGQRKIEWQGVFGSRLYANTLFANSGYVAWRRVQSGFETVVNRLDRETSQQTGGNQQTTTGKRFPARPQVIGTVDYHLSSKHSLQAGYRVQWGSFRTEFPSRADGDYRLIYDRVGGVAHQPVEMVTLNRPVEGTTRQNMYVLHATDTWRPTTRLTVNMGLRWQRNANWVPAQEKIQGRWGTAGSFPRIETGTWNTLAPRFGIAFDLRGNGRTVLKSTYGLYNHEWPYNFNVGFGHDYNQNTVTETFYRWRDLDGNNDYTPGEVNLNLNGPDFLNVAGATNNLINPDLKTIRTHEVTAAFEHALGDSLSLRGLYVYKKTVDQVGVINALRPYSVYNRAFTRRDPGPDGLLNTADDGGPVTLYDYDPAYRGAAFVGNMRVNADRDDFFNNFEITLNKRSTGKWFAFTSLLATKYHRWLEAVPQNLNQELFPLDETWELAYRLAGGYEAPMGINLSTVYQAYTGIPGQRTYVFRAADPAGGPAFPSSSTITLRMEPYGAISGPSRHIVNMRVGKDFRIGGTRKIGLQMDAFNLFNSNVAWGQGTDPGISFVSGPTYGYVVRIVSPRVVSLGAIFEF
jgi:hypothetical protein